jgi:hypothetical protein
MPAPLAERRRSVVLLPGRAALALALLIAGACSGQPGPRSGGAGAGGEGGSAGSDRPNGIFASMNAPAGPKSLHLAQLCERLGPQALVNIGYR